MKTLPFAVALTLVACGGGDSTTEPPNSPAMVTITSAAPVYSEADDRDDIGLRVLNLGGEGTYYLEFKASPISPNGNFRISRGEPVLVSKGYQESFVAHVTGYTLVVKVFTRPINTAVYSLTDCQPLRDADSTTYCR